MQLSYSVNETADAIGIGLTKTYALINTGKLPAKKLGKRTIILKTNLDEFLSSLDAFTTKEQGA